MDSTRSRNNADSLIEHFGTLYTLYLEAAGKNKPIIKIIIMASYALISNTQ